MDIADLVNSPAGLAIKGALIAAFLDFAFGVFAAVRDGSFALDAVAAFVRKHLLGRVLPCSVLAITGYLSNDPLMISAAAAALSAYAAETLASIYGSIADMRSKTAEANPIPTE